MPSIAFTISKFESRFLWVKSFLLVFGRKERKILSGTKST